MNTQNQFLRLDRIELKNYRRFSSLAVDFDPQLTVVVARNGCGKTAVLDAIAVALGPFVGAFDAGKGVHFAPSDVRQAKNSSAALTEMEPQYPLQLTATGIVNGGAATWSRELAGTKAHTTYGDARALIDYGKQLQRLVRDAADGKLVSVPLLPIVSYYGTGRLWSEKRLTSGKKSAEASSRTVAYMDCLDSASRYKMFSDWFERLCRSEFEERDVSEKQQDIRNLLTAIRTAVDTVLAPSGWCGISFKSSELGIVADHPTEGRLPVQWLSDGIRNLVGLAADIAHRAVRVNAHLGEEAVRQTPGIVLIDEVDMHLHPEWQQVVLTSLREAFPLIQFIVTTHSPQVLTTVKREHVRLLDANGSATIPADGTFGAESARVLEEVFGVHSRPQTVEPVAKLRQYLDLVEAGNAATPAACALRRELNETLGKSDPDLHMADIRASQLKVLRPQ